MPVPVPAVPSPVRASPRMRWRDAAGSVAVVGFVAVQLCEWLIFALPSDRPAELPVWRIATTAGGLLYVIEFSIYVARRGRARTWAVVVLVLNATLMVLGFYAVLYWACGTTANFTVSLSKLDALYFAMGTLTTAGTGNIAPVSELARGVVFAQMASDLLLMAVAVALVVTRIGERKRAKAGQA